jgi:hypothetical protein
MWRLFVAIGDFWSLPDDTSGYRGRLRAFMANRVSLDAAYLGYYALAAQMIEDLLATASTPAEGYAALFTTKLSMSDPDPEMRAVKERVVDEFIAWRLALGGFRAFGAENYRGYFGGANIPGEPIPYRPRDSE